MLKRLVILAITAFVAVSVSGQPNQASDTKQSVGKHGQPSASSAGTNDKQGSGQADQSKSASNPAGNTTVERPHWWSIPDWWLVIVASITGGFICWQSIETRKAAQGAKENAVVALKTVQVMIDSERPWVVAHMEQSKKACLLDNGNVRFTWTVKNLGNSPAKLIEAGAMVSLDTMGPPTNQIHYKMESLKERILVPGESAPIFVFWSIVENGRVRTRLGKTLDEFNDLAIVYGCIRYRSAINAPDVYETRFNESSSISSGVCDGFEPSWPTDPEGIRCT
jgi:hypothetical protein